MTEFNNRIVAQRKILLAVNNSRWNEELYGLSRGALDRWFRANSLDRSSVLASLLTDAARKLFFLANKSQEQVTAEYRLCAKEVAELIDKIRLEAARSSPTDVDS